jgi:hypothetical protein
MSDDGGSWPPPPAPTSGEIPPPPPPPTSVIPAVADVDTPADGYGWDVGPDPDETASGRAHMPWRERHGRAARLRKASEPIITPGEPEQRRHTWTIFVGLVLPVALILLGIGFLLAPGSGEAPNDTALPPPATLPPGETLAPAAPVPADDATATTAAQPIYSDPQQEAMTLATQLTDALAAHDFDAARSISAAPREDVFYTDRYPFAAEGVRATVSLVPLQVTPAGPNLFDVRGLLQARNAATGEVTFVCVEWNVDAASGKIPDPGAVPLDDVTAAAATAACQSADL